MRRKKTQLNMSTVKFGFFMVGAAMVAGAIPDVFVFTGSFFLDRELHEELLWSDHYKNIISVLMGGICMLRTSGPIDEILNSKDKAS